MWNKLGAIVGLVIGISLIIFRRRVRSFYLRKHFKEHTTPKKLEYHRQMKEMKLEGILHKGLEIAAIVSGVLILLWSIPELFFPKADKYVTYLFGFFALSLCATGAAAIVELTLLFPLLWRSVHKYTREHYPDPYRSIQDSSGNGTLNAVSPRPTDDLVLRSLERKAIIYTVFCFVVLFVIFLLVFYTIFRLTG